MFDFLNSPWAFGSIVVVSLALCFVIWKTGSITIAKLGLTIGGSNKKEKLKSSPHANCPHSRDIMDLVHRTAEHFEKIQTLKASILREQMRYYEEIEEELLGKLKHLFIKILLDKTPENEVLVEQKDYKNYILILKVISSDLKSYVRNCFSSNHYITYTIETQRDYIDKKRIVIIQKVTEALNEYWRGEIVKRSEIAKKNKENMREFEERIEDLFDKAFLISRETQDRIEKEIKEYEDYISIILEKK